MYFSLHKFVFGLTFSIMSPKKKRWNKNCKAAKWLKDGLMNGDIDASDTPKSIFDANKKDVLKGFELGQFRTQYNKMKGELGINVRGG